MTSQLPLAVELHLNFLGNRFLKLLPPTGLGILQRQHRSSALKGAVPFRGV